MGADSKIEWTDATWNPARGCSRVSPGCENCYAEKMAARFSAPGRPFHGFAVQDPARWTRKVALVPEMLPLPLRWKKPRRIFVNSMSDLFHEALSGPDVARVWAVMAAASWHTFQVLTKRAERMAEMLTDPAFRNQVAGLLGGAVPAWPLPNVWVGVSVEDQPRADERIQHLLRVPAVVRFLSCEPLLGPVDLTRHLRPRLIAHDGTIHYRDEPETKSIGGRWELAPIGWVIVGGESGSGARPMRLGWAESIVRQCREAGVPCFFKQAGAQPVALDGVTLRLRNRKGGDLSELGGQLGDGGPWPREFPTPETGR